MINFTRYKALLWDFDGVLMDSMPVRDEGFRKVLEKYPADEVMKLMDFHRKNGGLSRYVKFRYFFEEIRREAISESEVMALAADFSKIMMELLINAELLINDSLDFVKEHYQALPMHIVSGSDGKELNEICRRLDIAKYFVSIHGSPTPKKQLVQQVIENNGYQKTEIALIGDSINDYDAAIANDIEFIGYNNIELHNKHPYYLEKFQGILIN